MDYRQTREMELDMEDSEGPPRPRKITEEIRKVVEAEIGQRIKYYIVDYESGMDLKELNKKHGVIVNHHQVVYLEYRVRRAEWVAQGLLDD